MYKLWSYFTGVCAVLVVDYTNFGYPLVGFLTVDNSHSLLRYIKCSIIKIEIGILSRYLT